jgi:hypothetical protein
MYLGLHVSTHYFCLIFTKFRIARQILMKDSQHLSFMEIHLVESVLLHAEKQTDGTRQSLHTISANMQTQLKINFYSRFFALATLQTYHSKFIISNSVLLAA